MPLESNQYLIIFFVSILSFFTANNNIKSCTNSTYYTTTSICLEGRKYLQPQVYQVNRLFDDLLGGSKIRLSVLPFDTELNINELPVITDEARFKCHNPHVSLGVKLSCIASKAVSVNRRDEQRSGETQGSQETEQEPNMYRFAIQWFVLKWFV